MSIKGKRKKEVRKGGAPQPGRNRDASELSVRWTCNLTASLLSQLLTIAPQAYDRKKKKEKKEKGRAREHFCGREAPMNAPIRSFTSASVRHPSGSPLMNGRES